MLICPNSNYLIRISHTRSWFSLGINMKEGAQDRIGDYGQKLELDDDKETDSDRKSLK